MKCPHCGYSNYKIDDKGQSAYGKYGDFYDISNDIVMIGDGVEDMYLHGCPKCKKLFMD